jgi:RNA polymerase sigma factor (sigma-70 family)
MSQPARDPADLPEAHVARWRATGDPHAFGALFDATAGVLFRVAVTLVRDAATAEDVLQQTYAVALKKLVRIEPGRPVMPWLLNVLQKEAAKARRRAGRTPDPVRLPPRTPSPDPAEVPEAPDTEAVRAAIESLEEPYRSAALLRWRYGLEPSEIAHVRGEPPGTTRSLLSRALERLKRAAPVLPVVFLGEVRPPRGLGGVRAAVVEQATNWGSAAGLGPAVVAVGGGLLVKKAIVGVVVLVVLLGGWALWRPAPGTERVDSQAARRPEAPAGAELAAGPAALARTRAERAAAAAAAATAPRVEGRVLDQEGRPVADAYVVIDAHDRSTFIESDSQHPDATVSSGATDSDGRFSLAMPDVSRGRALILAKGYAVGEIDDVTPGRLKDLVLRRAGRLHGRVVDTKGRTIAGARVRWLAILGAFHTEDATTSDASGEFRFDGVGWMGSKAGAKLVVDAQGYARQILDPYDVTGRFPPDLSGDVELDVVLTRGAGVEGRVVLADGTPAPGAHVALWTMEFDLSISSPDLDGPTHPARAHVLGETNADAKGRFAFEHAPSRGFHDVRREVTSMVTGRKVGAWLVASSPGTTTAIGEVALEDEGGVVPVEMRLHPAFSVVGRVVDGAGQPVPGAQVWANVLREGLMVGIPADLRSMFPVESALSATDGTYRMEGVRVPGPTDPPFGVGAALRLRQFGNGERDSSFVTVKGPYEGVLHAPDVVLKAHPLPFGNIRVLDEGDRPVANARLGFSEGLLNFRTDAEGRARVNWFAVVPPESGLGPQPLIVRATGFAVSSPLLPLSRNIGDVAEEVVVRLRQGHAISGRVTADGGPLPEGTKVSVGDGRLTTKQAFPSAFPDREYERVPSGTLGEFGSVAVAADGSFEVTELPEGPYHVLVSWEPPSTYVPGERVAPIVAVRSDVPTGATSVDIVLRVPPAVTTRDVDLRVVDADSGEPALRPWGELIGSDAGTESGVRRVMGRRLAPGILRLRGVVPGRYDFHGGAEGYAMTSVGPVVVEAIDAAPLPVVRVRRGARVAGKVTLPDGGPLKGQVLFEPYDGDVGKVIVSVDASGAFEASGLPPGRYRVTANSQVVPDFASFASAPVSLVDVTADTTEVHLDGAWVLAGRASVVAKGARFRSESPQGFFTPAQVESLKGLVFEVAEATGRVVHRRTAMTTSDSRVSFVGVLPPGSYVARLSLPGEPARERRFEVVAGQAVSVGLE